MIKLIIAFTKGFNEVTEMPLVSAEVLHRVLRGIESEEEAYAAGIATARVYVDLPEEEESTSQN